MRYSFGGEWGRRLTTQSEPGCRSETHWRAHLIFGGTRKCITLWQNDRKKLLKPLIKEILCLQKNKTKRSLVFSLWISKTASM